MCCFSGPVERVANTRIFARRAENGRQILVYQMEYAARRPVAMILPLPVARQAGGDAPLVRFVSLKHYPYFFSDLDRAFPIPQPKSAARSDGAAMTGAARPMPTLAVESIGEFVASFVPTLADFKRLDKRFVLPPQTWNQIPDYDDYGFAVFQLKARPNGEGVHPMAFSFASRFSDRLFFPTVHIHDGQVHATADFDHDLYWQPLPPRKILGVFGGQLSAPDDAEYVRPSDGSVAYHMNTARTKGLIDGVRTGLKARLPGNLENRDTFIKDGA